MFTAAISLSTSATAFRGGMALSRLHRATFLAATRTSARATLTFSTTTDNEFLTGTVKFYDKRKNWGIIIGRDNQEYFIHRRSIISWISVTEDLHHPFLKVMEEVRFKAKKSTVSHKAMEALELTFLDGSQVPAYREQYVESNLTRLAHVLGEKVYSILSNDKVNETEKLQDVLKNFEKTKLLVDVHKKLAARQVEAFAAMKKEPEETPQEDQQDIQPMP